ncbi:MAG: PD40 domain-containing protein [Deltaproteobacteria bacterium]|nr:PD40 domain-containing protein [Deltaproteobacteria bacterium]MBN2672793.1 PD40 domain-containing protein [Deltaproteobacteria bacterium]
MTQYSLQIIGFSLLLTIAVGLPQAVISENDKEKKNEEEALPAMDENAPLEVDIWGGIRDLYSIAVPTPLGAADVAKEVKEVQETDYVLSSLFKVLDSKSFLADLDAEGMNIDKDPWVQVGAQGVTKCTVTKAGESVSLSFALFEVARGTTPVLKKTYKGTAGEVRGMVHQWVNEVIKHFTGEPGAFGTRLAFARKTGPKTKHIFTADWTGGGVGKVTRNNSINILPAFGPGGSIYYTSFVEGAPYLYRTGQRQPVLNHPGLNMGATFYGGKMAVVLSKDGNPEIYLGNADGSGLKRLTSSGSIDVSPSFSPDGSKIAFVSDRHGSPQIFVMGAGGGGAKRVTFKGSYNQTPSWCPRPGSNLIAFTGRDGGTYDVFTVDAGGGQIRRLTQNQGRNMDPAFSPDCRQVAFHSSRGGIFISNPEGLNQQQVIGGSAETIKWSR